MLYVFFLQFLNTGPLTLLANGDFRELEIPILSKYFTYGFYRDFTVNWYMDVGK